MKLLMWYILRWLRGPVNILQGIAQTISFGFWEPDWIFKSEGLFLDYTFEVFHPEEKKVDWEDENNWGV